MTSNTQQERTKLDRLLMPSIVLLLVLGWGILFWYSQRTLGKAQQGVEQAWSYFEAACEMRTDFHGHFASQLRNAGERVQESLERLDSLGVRLRAALDEAGGSYDVDHVVAIDAARSRFDRQMDVLWSSVSRDPALGREATSSVSALMQGMDHRTGAVALSYNQAVGAYNAAIQSMPARLFARLLGHSARAAIEP